MKWFLRFLNRRAVKARISELTDELCEKADVVYERTADGDIALHLLHYSGVGRVEIPETSPPTWAEYCTEEIRHRILRGHPVIGEMERTYKLIDGLLKSPAL